MRAKFFDSISTASVESHVARRSAGQTVQDRQTGVVRRKEIGFEINLGGCRVDALDKSRKNSAPQRKNSIVLPAENSMDGIAPDELKIAGRLTKHQNCPDGEVAYALERARKARRIVTNESLKTSNNMKETRE